MTDDLKYSIRTLSRAPAFAVVAILTLALGIGLNTSVFSIVNVMLFRPLPVERPEELVWISSASTKPDGPRGNMTYRDVVDLASMSVLSGATAYGGMRANVAHEGVASRLEGQIVTENYFTVLGIRAHRGRLIDRDAAADRPSAVISYSLWQRMFGGGDDAIGAEVWVNGRPFVVTGVAPRGFRGADVFAPADLWLGLGSAAATVADLSDPLSRTSWWMRAVGRLARDTSRGQASAALNARAAAIAQAFPASHDGFTVVLHPVRGAAPGDRAEVTPLAALLMGVTMAVLLIACGNVANLLLVRGVGRGRETAVRAALGATRARLVRLQLVESGLLATAGGALGLLLSLWGTELLVRFAGAPLEADLGPDRRVLLFAMATSALTALLFGIAPAVRAAAAPPAPSLKNESGSAGQPRSRLQAVLVAGQVALSLVLLLAAGLFLQSLIMARGVNVGFDPRERVSLSFNLRMHGYSPDRAAAFHEALLDRVRAQAGIRSATLATYVPLGGRVAVADLNFPDRPADPNARPERVSVNYVRPEFFSTLTIPLVAGRPLDRRDMPSARSGAPSSAVINETMARRFWGERSALGQRFSVDGPRGPFVEVVGIARDTITDEFTERPWAAAYLPAVRSGEDVALIAHTSLPPADALRALESDLHALDGTVAVFQPMTLEQHIAERMDGERGLSRVLGVAGLLATTLAAMGLYGVVAYTVARRTREIGVRIALGARREDVVKLFVGEAGRLALAGVAVGVVPGVALTVLLANSLVGVGIADPAAMGGAILLLAAAMLAAAYIPARRATTVDPLIALRAE
jgi:predicted permease